MKNMISMLPVECISHIISLTSPRDACRSSLVSSVVREAADSDFVWKSFLPQDIKQIISKSLLPSPSSLNSISMKDLYFHLRIHHQHIILDGNMSFALEKQSGKKCYMVCARGLTIAWGDTPAYWHWITLLHSRFAEVAELKRVWWLDIKACIETKDLSPGTTYAAYLVYQLSQHRYGLESPLVSRISYQQSDVVTVHRVILDPRPPLPRARDRGDGWIEVEIGEFFIEQGDDDDIVECSVKEVSNSKRGLIVEGIEVRPKGRAGPG
ncbi:putative F-box protein PP2-B12 isoform X2 [Rosa chinensis]|uniref:putative F-box protein PP2-B12 isoform X2 n=1 Tax=Rosa chinensis TaxID=74649 RepID=UPI001AD9015B|nr:putative F-box protein PP2-B12 isoform X2 [Rosa chinensis]